MVLGQAGENYNSRSRLKRGVMQIREINPTGRGKQLQFHASTLITSAPDEHVRNLLGCYRPSGSLPVPVGRVFVPVVLDRAILWERYTKRQNS